MKEALNTFYLLKHIRKIIYLLKGKMKDKNTLDQVAKYFHNFAAVLRFHNNSKSLLKPNDILNKLAHLSVR